MAERAVITGVEGPVITDWERAFLRESDPWGFILFARNVVSPDQVVRLTSGLRDAVGRDAPVLIDQEGGRVQRLRAPYWREYLPALDQMRQCSDPLRGQWLRNRLIAAELYAVGIDVNCAPTADLVEPGTHPVLLNRLYGEEVATVVDAAQACADALIAGGVLPVVKHIPGYGRAVVDSHLELPRNTCSLEELIARDFAPFAALNTLPMGMTAHIVFDAIDPDRPATTSPEVMRVIRETIGFSGLIMTDDLSMNALSGTLATRARAAIDAGCDIILHCNGKQADMMEVAEATPRMSDLAASRAGAALALRRDPEPADIAALEAELGALLAGTA
jgi:beta-N-acetylhexosaminidase